MGESDISLCPSYGTRSLRHRYGREGYEIEGVTDCLRLPEVLMRVSLGIARGSLKGVRVLSLEDVLEGEEEWKGTEFYPMIRDSPRVKLSQSGIYCVYALLAEKKEDFNIILLHAIDGRMLQL